VEAFAMREFNRFHFDHLIDVFPKDWSPLHFVGHLVHNIHARHIAQDLATRDNHILSDMGIFRGEVEHAAHVAITHDALEELEDARSHHLDAVDATVLRDVAGLNHTNLRSKL
jgi:hypothetical protein